MGEFIKRHRGALMTLALFLAFTIAYPIAVDQGWFRYNPYVLPVVLLTAMVLIAIWFLHAERVNALARVFVQQRGRLTGMLTIILTFGVVGALFGWVYYEMLRVSKEHVAGLLNNEHPSTTVSPSGEESDKARAQNELPSRPPRLQEAGPTSASHVDPSGSLSQLGWTVKRDAGSLTFEVVNKPLPRMDESSKYFARLREPFRLTFQTVPNLDGLQHLWGKGKCQQITLSASDLSSVSQIAGFESLQKLEISQVPLNTHEDIDTAPLSRMINLTSLVLNSSGVSDLTPIARMSRLQSLTIEGTRIRDLSPIRPLRMLKTLDVRDSKIVDLSPAADSKELEELIVDTNQVKTLGALSSLPMLHKLNLIGQVPVDLSQIGKLTHLRSLFILGPPSMNLDFLSELPEVTDLQISGFGAPVGPRSQVTGSDALCAGGNLKRLTLGALEIRSLAFASQCKSLTEINLRDIPLVSLNELGAVPTLRKISLIDISVVEISPLLTLPDLEQLTLIRVPARADVLAALERKGVKVENP